MIYNIQALDAELKAAGVPIVGVSGTKVGRIDFSDGSSWTPGMSARSAQERATKVVVDVHDADAVGATAIRHENEALAIDLEVKRAAAERLGLTATAVRLAAERDIALAQSKELR